MMIPRTGRYLNKTILSINFSVVRVLGIRLVLEICDKLVARKAYYMPGVYAIRMRNAQAACLFRRLHLFT